MTSFTRSISFEPPVVEEWLRRRQGSRPKGSEKAGLPRPPPKREPDSAKAVEEQQDGNGATTEDS